MWIIEKGFTCVPQRVHTLFSARVSFARLNVDARKGGHGHLLAGLSSQTVQLENETTATPTISETYPATATRRTSDPAACFDQFGCR